jgi:hypothetical protein
MSEAIAESITATATKATAATAAKAAKAGKFESIETISSEHYIYPHDFTTSLYILFIFFLHTEKDEFFKIDAILTMVCTFQVKPYQPPDKYYTHGNYF